MAEFVPYTHREGYQLNDVPANLRKRLNRLARKHNTSVANVIGEIFSKQYDVPFSPSHRQTPPAPNTYWSKAGPVSFRLPREVMDRIRDQALRENVTLKTVMLTAMYDSFGLKRPASTHLPGKRPGRRKET
jgi:hypothetical protein